MELTIKHLSKRYGEKLALDDFSYSFREAISAYYVKLNNITILKLIMKKYIIFPVIVLLVSCCLLFSGCGKERIQNGTTEEPFFPNNHSEYVKNGSLLYFVEENIGLQSSISYRLMVLDLENGDCMPLCGKPECTHDVETCNAQISSGIVKLMLYQDRLYWIGGTEHNLLLSVALDGTDRKELMQLDKELYREVWGFGSAAIYDDVLYLCGVGRSIRDSVPVDAVTVFRQRLGSEQGELIYHSTEFTEVFGRISEEQFWFAAHKESFQDEVELCETRLFTYDINTGALWELYRDKEPGVLYNYLLASNQTVYLGGYNKGIAYSMEDGHVKTFDMKNGLYHSIDIGDGYFLYWKNAHDYACHDSEGKLLFEGSFPPDTIEFLDDIPIRSYIGYSSGKMYYKMKDYGVDGSDDRSYIVEFDLKTQAVKALYSH